jgi:hypothetical protein
MRSSSTCSVSTIRVWSLRSMTCMYSLARLRCDSITVGGTMPNTGRRSPSHGILANTKKKCDEFDALASNGDLSCIDLSCIGCGRPVCGGMKYYCMNCSQKFDASHPAL